MQCIPIVESTKVNKTVNHKYVMLVPVWNIKVISDLVSNYLVGFTCRFSWVSGIINIPWAVICKWSFILVIIQFEQDLNYKGLKPSHYSRFTKVYSQDNSIKRKCLDLLRGVLKRFIYLSYIIRFIQLACKRNVPMFPFRGQAFSSHLTAG